MLCCAVLPASPCCADTLITISLPAALPCALPCPCPCSVCLVKFDSHPEDGTLLAVGTAQGLRFYPKECQGGLAG